MNITRSGIYTIAAQTNWTYSINMAFLYQIGGLRGHRRESVRVLPGGHQHFPTETLDFFFEPQDISNNISQANLSTWLNKYAVDA